MVDTRERDPISERSLRVLLSRDGSGCNAHVDPDTADIKYTHNIVSDSAGSRRYLVD